MYKDAEWLEDMVHGRLWSEWIIRDQEDLLAHDDEWLMTAPCAVLGSLWCFGPGISEMYQEESLHASPSASDNTGFYGNKHVPEVRTGQGYHSQPSAVLCHMH